MNWVDDFDIFRHNVFIVFIECKIDERGNWRRKNSIQSKSGYEVVVASDNSEYNMVQLIEPDGLRRNLLFKQGATFSINQNVFSYASGFAREIIVDEKAQAGKEKTRDTLD
jgi:hypothetical protein